MSAPGGPPERTGRHLARYDVPVPRTRAPKPVPIDDDLLDAWADYERANARANRAYDNDTRGEAHQPNQPRRSHR